MKALLHQMEGYEMTDISDPRMVFFDFLEFLVKDDIVFLQSYEDSLNELEEDLLARKQDNFERRILQVRKELAVLGAYYEPVSYTHLDVYKRQTMKSCRTGSSV